jgi:hypothetical protein
MDKISNYRQIVIDILTAHLGLFVSTMVLLLDRYLAIIFACAGDRGYSNTETLLD